MGICGAGMRWLVNQCQLFRVPIVVAVVGESNPLRMADGAYLVIAHSGGNAYLITLNSGQ